MSYFEDYIEGGLCCEGCGEFLGGSEPGHVRYCSGCAPDEPRPPKAPKKGKGKCTVCGKRFGGVLAARQHMRDAHGIPINTPNEGIAQ